MHIRINHSTRYTYERPVRSLGQMLRVTPRPTSGQTVRSWRVATVPFLPLRTAYDAFGNVVTLLFTDQPLRALDIEVSGEIETRDTGGVLSEAREPLDPLVFLRETPLTHCDAALAAFTEEIAGGGGAPLEVLHRLLHAVHDAMVFDPDSTHPATAASEAFGLGRGVCQDLAQVFIVAARRLEIPARYVSGHFARGDGVVDQAASHAWAEALVPDLGWVGFDPTNGISAGEQHIRVATALDYLGAAPVRGSRSGGGEEAMTVELRVEPDRAWQAQRQSQSQSQSQS